VCTAATHLISSVVSLIVAQCLFVTATHRNTLQHPVRHCNALQRSATHCNTLQHTLDSSLVSLIVAQCLFLTATYCNTLQYTATHCNTLQHTATHFHTLQHTLDSNGCRSDPNSTKRQRVAATQRHQCLSQYFVVTPMSFCRSFLVTATNCNTQQHTATHCHRLQYTATQCSNALHATNYRCGRNSRHT